MKRLLLSLFILVGLTSQSQMIVNPYLFGGAPPLCPTAFGFFDFTNMTESPTGTYACVDPDADSWAQGDVAIPASTDGSFECEYLAASNTTNFAISWHVSDAITGPFYSSARYTLFVYGEEYWYNDDLAGAVSTAVIPADGDKFRLIRTGSTIKAQYFRSSTWTDLHTFSGTQTNQLFFFISSAQNGETIRMLNPKHCGGDGIL